MNEHDEHQVCRVCGNDLPLHHFHRNNRTRTGRIRVCRPCRSATRQDYYLPSMEERLAAITFSDLVRFSDYYAINEDGCWIWQGGLTNTYPSFWLRGGRIRAHRFSVVAAGIELDLDDEVHHECGVRLCVNPRHLTPMSREAHQSLHLELRRRKKALVGSAGR